MKAILSLLALALFSTPLSGQDRIEDNSFLLEEAYNQEAGIVQHISAFSRVEGGDWEYALTQEWPFMGQRHQLSYTVPLQRIGGAGGGGTKIGDIALNYRHQVLGIGGGNVAWSPRLSLLLPTGDETTGHGAGAAGFQVNIPVSVLLAPRLVTHYNAGATLTPSARNALGAKASTTSYNLGASIIFLATPSFNLMLEGGWGSSESVSGTDLTDRSEEAYLNPGIRFAINTRGGLQIVPGIAYTIGIGPSEGQSAVFLYLSFEHAFKRSASGDS